MRRSLGLRLVISVKPLVVTWQASTLNEKSTSYRECSQVLSWYNSVLVFVLQHDDFIGYTEEFHNGGKHVFILQVYNWRPSMDWFQYAEW